MKGLARVYRIDPDVLLKRAKIIEGKSEMPEVIHPALRSCLERLEALPRQAQPTIARMILPIIDHIEADEGVSEKKIAVLRAAAHPEDREEGLTLEADKVVDRHAKEIRKETRKGEGQNEIAPS